MKLRDERVLQKLNQRGYSLLVHYDEVKREMDAAQQRGVEIWQANFELTPERVRLDRCFRISV